MRWKKMKIVQRTMLLMLMYWWWWRLNKTWWNMRNHNHQMHISRSLTVQKIQRWSKKNHVRLSTKCRWHKLKKLVNFKMIKTMLNLNLILSIVKKCSNRILNLKLLIACLHLKTRCSHQCQLHTDNRWATTTKVSQHHLHWCRECSSSTKVDQPLVWRSQCLNLIDNRCTNNLKLNSILNKNRQVKSKFWPNN